MCYGDEQILIVLCIFLSDLSATLFFWFTSAKSENSATFHRFEQEPGQKRTILEFEVVNTSAYKCV